MDGLRPLLCALAAAAAAAGGASALPVTASAHQERPALAPDGAAGKVPALRTSGRALVVCKNDSRARIRKLPSRRMRKRNLALLRKCRFRHVQEAVDAARSGYRILILPGVYKEEPSRAVPFPDPRCADLLADAEAPEDGSAAMLARTARGGAPARVASYEYDVRCPRSRNLIALSGDSPDDPDRACDARCRLQIEGAARRQDVVIAAGGTKLNVIKADRADGVQLSGFTVEHAGFAGVHVLETDGFAVRDVAVSGSREHGFVSYASVGGLFEDLEVAHAGGAGIHPGAGPETGCERYAIEIRGVDSHHNTIGLAGAGGTGAWVHGSRFHHNAAGVAMESLTAGHAGGPQHCSKLEGNLVFSNNADVFGSERDAYCRRPWEERDAAVVCPTAPVPVGTGVVLAGANRNLVMRNRIWDNWRGAFELLWVPATLRGESDPGATFDSSNANQFADNVLGYRPDGAADHNGRMLLWDEEGTANCWSANKAAPGPSSASDPVVLPACPLGSVFSPGNPLKLLAHASCWGWDPAENPDPAGCTWLALPAEPR